MVKVRSKLAHVLVAATAVACMIGTPADARRGGSFGSRGSRTYSMPHGTSIMGRQVAPVQRSMTPPSANGANPTVSPWRTQNYGPEYGQPQPPRRFGGVGRGLIGGLIAGGLIGALMGHGGGWGMGYGGMGGSLVMSLIQLLILGGLIWFVVGLFRRTSLPSDGNLYDQNVTQFGTGQPYGAPAAGTYGAQPQPMMEFAIIDSDKAEFERLLEEVQDAFGREDYGRLRELTTPEVMSYLSEELSQNATNGKRNEVSATRLIDAEIAEAWREANAEYATIAMRYESIDIMRDRTSGAIVSGDPRYPTEASELWTFIRPIGGAWKLSAIQT